MEIKNQVKAAKEFKELWKGKGKEKQEAQKYWLQLLRDVYGVKEPEQYIDFELPIKINRTSFADGYIEKTHTLIEMKSVDVDLTKKEKQSDGEELTPFQQAKRYSDSLGYYQRARWIIVSNFKSIDIYDMAKTHSDPIRVELEDLDKHYYVLKFLVDEKDEEIKKEEDVSFEAGNLVGRIYDALSDQYVDIKQESSQKSLNQLCVRLVFCLYAEDSGLFGTKTSFHDYLSKYDISNFRDALIKLFKILDTHLDKRDPYLDKDLLSFPYVNGGLFSEENIEIPTITQEIKDLILSRASNDFDWSQISPTIFGAVFESTLNPETRHENGMHYTSIENIHKVIDPLFLNELYLKFENLKDSLSSESFYKKEKAYNNFQNYLSTLTFFDPACGSGNFLTETYLSLRKLENEVIKEKSKFANQFAFEGSDESAIKVSISQFYGVEVNDFAVSVAKTALWIAEAQMFEKTQDILMYDENTNVKSFLPLKTISNITEGNAIRLNWNEIVPKESLTYIIGNPPFVGTKLMTKEQRNDRTFIFESDEYGKLDYVSCWYKKCSDYMLGTKIKAALVSTNSITQGEQTSLLWEPLFKKGLVINFAYRTFQWDSEASIKAHVHCVIIGFSYTNSQNKVIFDKNRIIPATNINAYLQDGPNVFIDKTQKPLFGQKPMDKGSQLIDGGYYVFTKQEMDDFIRQNPESKTYFYKYINADSYLNNRDEKYCLCLKDCPPDVIKRNKGIYDRVQKVYEFRANSEADSTNKLKDRPQEFFITNIPKGVSILVPVVSSERRKYIPMGFIEKGVIYTNANNYIDNATLYDFGIMISNIHMAWMRAFCGRLKSDFRYSKDLIYNTFPLPNPTKEQRIKINNSAQLILNIREKFKDCSLAELYDPMSMPPELKKAHHINDIAVMEAYGFDYKTMSEEECVAVLMKMYQKRINEMR